MYYDGETIRDVDLATICALMLKIEGATLGIEEGDGGGPDFLLAEPGLGPALVSASGVILESGAMSWILERKRRRNYFYLALGGRMGFFECIHYGCPQRVRTCCLPALDEAVPALAQTLDGKKLARPWHWMGQGRAFDLSF